MFPRLVARNRCTILFFLSTILSCTAGRPMMDSLEPLGEYVAAEDEYSAVQYWDRDEVSLNDHCPNTGTRLATVIEPLYVNGRPIGFC